MNILFEVKFDWSLLFGFFAGVFAAAVIIALLYLMFALKHIKSYKLKNISQEEIKKNTKERIENTKLALEEAKLDSNERINYTIDLCKKLVTDTAKDFFPNSKYPIYELSIDEVLLLVKYIEQRVDELLSAKLFKPLKKIKISYIMSIYNKKEQIEANEIVVLTKKYKVMQAFNATRKVVNLINPFWWAKNLVVNKAIDVILKKLCLMVIDIVGEETYNIYSKHVFLDDDTITSNLKEEIKLLETELKETSYEE